MEKKGTDTAVEKPESVLKPAPGTKVCIISKKELEELKRTNKLKQTDPTKSPNVFLIKQQLCDKLRTSEPNKKFVLKHVVRTKSTEGTGEKKPVFHILNKSAGAATTSTIEVKKDNEGTKDAQTEQKKGVIFKTKIISNSKVKVSDTDIKKIFTSKTPNILKRIKVDNDYEVKFKPNGKPAKTYLRNPDSYTESMYEKEEPTEPVKRKRGRPRKNESNRKPVDDDASTDDEDWSPNKTTSKKRKRSHRKKVYDDEEDEDEMWSSYQEDEDEEEEEEEEDKSSAVEDEVKSSTEETEKPKRKRGRPPKPPAAPAEGTDNKNEEVKSEDSSSSPTKVPKKRGRPRKNPQPPSPQPNDDDDEEEEDEKAKSEDVSSADETMPTTRRRSRKNINYFELANPKSFDEWADEKRQAEKNEKSDQQQQQVNKDVKKTTKVTKIVITEKRVTPDYVEIGFCTKDLNEQDHEIVQQEKNKPDEQMVVEKTTDVDTVDSKEKGVKVIKSSEDGKSGENGEVIYVIQQIDNDGEIEKKDNDLNDEKKDNIDTETVNEEETLISVEKNIEDSFEEKPTEIAEEVEEHDSGDAADKKEAVEEESKTPTTATTTTTTSNGENSEVADVNSNESKIVKCQTCKQELELILWCNHNKLVHNLLSWHSNETQPDFTNSDTVIELIEPLLREKKGLKCDKCFLKLKDARLFAGHWMNCKGTNAPTTTCGVCQMIMPKSLWNIHKHKQHNNLTWQIGEPPLDLSNKSLVMGILNALYKSKKPLYCEKCGGTKKSVVGYLSHRSTCMKSSQEKESLKEQCPHCPAKILPASMSYHLNTVHSRTEKKVNPVAKPEFNPNSKRNAAKKALSIINKISGEVEENKYYSSNLNFSEADFIRNKLEEELDKNPNLSCKFQDCTVECDTIEDFITHSNTCQLKPSSFFVCKNCLLIVTTEEQIKQHIQKDHNVKLVDNDEEFDVEEVDEPIEELDNEFRVKKRSILNEKSKNENDFKYKPKPQFILKTIKNRKPTKLFFYALSWMTDFCRTNYSKPLLFENYRVPINNWSLMDVKNIKNYLPPLTQSCDIAFTTVKGFENCLTRDYDLKKLNLFENCSSDNDDCFVFCGGPITALSWLPTPHTAQNAPQILALSTLSDPNLNCVYNRVYNEKTIIQFWDFGVIRNKKSIKNIDPKLLFGICVDYGPIWHLEWCPSGCYDEEIRLGMLAVAASNGFVYIYSIPILNDAQKGLFYKNKTVARLQLDSNEKPTNYYATRISWSKVSGHSFIACGYSNGIVALYDLNNDSKLLKANRNHVLLPYKRFIAHAHYISVLSLLHLNNGNRWLLTGSFDKYVNVWDLESGMKVSSSKKNIIADGGWLTHWLAYVANNEESACLHPIHSTITNVRNFLSDSTNINISVSSLRAVSYSDWLNLIVNGNSCGEMFCFVGHQLLHCTESDKMIKYSKYLLGYITLVEKNKTPKERCAEEELKQKALKNTLKTRTKLETKSNVTHLDYNPHYFKYEPVNYLQTCEKYGLVFCDLKLNTFNDFPKNMADQLGNNGAKYHILKPNLYALQAINKISVNPNKYSSTFLAVGYQSGFLRVSCLKFLNNDEQVA